MQNALPLKYPITRVLQVGHTEISAILDMILGTLETHVCTCMRYLLPTCMQQMLRTGSCMQIILHTRPCTHLELYAKRYVPKCVPVYTITHTSTLLGFQSKRCTADQSSC